MFRFVLVVAILALIFISGLPDCVLVCNKPEQVGAKTATELAAHPFPFRKHNKQGKEK
jgi:hypothetical protein